MSITIKFPAGVDVMDYLVSFSEAFDESELIKSSLLGVADSLRQADLLVGEPLGMLACLTAEEDAASFLYYTLSAKGYSVPQYGKLHNHRDKLKLVVFAQAMHHYFFSLVPEELNSAIVIERDEGKPKIYHTFSYKGYLIRQEDYLETIVSEGEGEQGHDNAVNAAVDKVIDRITPSGFTFASHIKRLSNRRNLCLYGDPKGKIRVRSVEEIEEWKVNCVSIIVLGFLIFNSDRPTASMVKLVDRIFSKMQI